jgi:hypothetical protein
MADPEAMRIGADEPLPEAANVRGVATSVTMRNERTFCIKVK